LLDNNDILRRLRYALNETDERMLAILGLAGQTVSQEQLRAFMGKENEEGALDCPDDFLGFFLDGLILDRRGPPKNGPSSHTAPPSLTNNMVLKKLRIALDLREDDMLKILASGGSKLSRGELSALFRRPGHKHHRMCGDQVIRNFLKGLTTTLRPSS
jgi:uncharacterized protein YehS (DUF1456 family)